MLGYSTVLGSKVQIRIQVLILRTWTFHPNWLCSSPSMWTRVWPFNLISPWAGLEPTTTSYKRFSPENSITMSYNFCPPMKISAGCAPAVGVPDSSHKIYVEFTLTPVQGHNEGGTIPRTSKVPTMSEVLLLFSAFACEIPRVRTCERQICFLPLAQSNPATPLHLSIGQRWVS